MAWTIDFTEKSERQLSKLDKSTKRQIVSYLRELERLEDPRSRGKALTGKLRGLWRYRVGDYRLVCSLEDGRLLILILNVDHRSKVYQSRS